jgi:anti-sigma-K factor RskA
VRTESSKSSIHTLSGAYVVDALDDAERVEFEEHLPGCPECQIEVTGLREAAAALADDAVLAPPPALRAAVLASIKTVRPLPPEVHTHAEEVAAPTSNVVALRPRRIRWGTMAIAAAVIAVLGIAGVAQPWHHGPSSTSASAIDQVITADDATHIKVQLAGGGDATVFRSVKEGKAALVAEDMPKAPSGKVYELWLRKASGDLVPAGLMSGSGTTRQLLKGNAAKAAAAAITVEPKGGSTAPTSEPIASFDFTQA